MKSVYVLTTTTSHPKCETTTYLDEEENDDKSTILLDETHVNSMDNSLHQNGAISEQGRQGGTKRAPVQIKEEDMDCSDG